MQIESPSETAKASTPPTSGPVNTPWVQHLQVTPALVLQMIDFSVTGRSSSAFPYWTWLELGYHPDWLVGEHQPGPNF